MKRTCWAVATLLVLASCTSKSSSTDLSTIGRGIDVETMSPPEAARVVAEFQGKYGAGPAPPPDITVTSMAQVLEIIRADRLPDFEEARRFAAGRQGAAALAVRSYLETSEADAHLLAASILEEERLRDLTELRQASTRRPLESSDEAADAARDKALKEKIEDLRKAVRALKVLSEQPLVAGNDLAKQAIRQDPKSQVAYLANANYYRLRGSWLEFDRMMRYAEDVETGDDPPVKIYLRAIEALERYNDNEKAKELLQETVAKRPDFVRAQAHLVLVDRDVEEQYAQLEKLRALNPDHLVARVVGPLIEEEYVSAQQLRQAR